MIGNLADGAVPPRRRSRRPLVSLPRPAEHVPACLPLAGTGGRPALGRASGSSSASRSTPSGASRSIAVAVADVADQRLDRHQRSVSERPSSPRLVLPRKRGASRGTEPAARTAARPACSPDIAARSAPPGRVLRSSAAAAMYPVSTHGEQQVSRRHRRRRPERRAPSRRTAGAGCGRRATACGRAGASYSRPRKYSHTCRRPNRSKWLIIKLTSRHHQPTRGEQSPQHAAAQSGSARPTRRRRSAATATSSRPSAMHDAST